jgi:hypothetical protein
VEYIRRRQALEREGTADQLTDDTPSMKSSLHGREVVLSRPIQNATFHWRLQKDKP